MHDYKDCVLYDRKCIECGECDHCDLNPEKICDNCGECLKTQADYLAIKIDGVLTQEETLDSEAESGSEAPETSN